MWRSRCGSRPMPHSRRGSGRQSAPGCSARRLRTWTRTLGTSSRHTCRLLSSGIPQRSPPFAMAQAATWSTRIDQARQRLAAGDIAAARREAEAIVADAASDAERGAAHLVLAACCEKDGDAAAALMHARTAVGCAPRNALAHYAHAELQETTGDKAGAVTSLRRALA